MKCAMPKPAADGRDCRRLRRHRATPTTTSRCRRARARQATPPDNTASPEKTALGRELFFDARLSRDERVSCATCHQPDKGFSNGERFAKGVGGKVGNHGRFRRVSCNVGLSGSLSILGWPRARLLRRRRLVPIQDPARDGHAAGGSRLAPKLNGIADYRRQFQAALRRRAGSRSGSPMALASLRAGAAGPVLDAHAVRPLPERATTSRRHCNRRCRPRA